MLFLGVDIAKLNHVASLINGESGELIFSNFSFENNINGFNSLIKLISSYNKKDIIIGLESTGHYGENFVHFFFNNEFNLAVINPMQINSMRYMNLNVAKNDRLDSILIAKFLIIGNYRFVSKKDITSLTLKRLNRFRDSIVKERSKLKIQLTSSLDITFPELQYNLKSGIHSKSIYQLLKKSPCAKDIAALRIDTLTNLLKENSKGHYTKSTAEFIKSLAKSSVGISDSSLSLHIIQLITSIELFDKQIDDIELEIKSILNSINSVISTIPGISDVASAAILGEIGNIDDFATSSKLLSFAGICPKVRQSGNFIATTGRMSKKGSKYLRYSLIYTAWNVVRHNITFKNYYDLKRSQGKSHYKALGHVAHKLVRIIFKLLKDSIPFNANILQ